MSDDEMNIDEGTYLYYLSPDGIPITHAFQVVLVGLFEERAEDSRVPLVSYAQNFYTIVTEVTHLFLEENGAGVSSGQKFDRIDSPQSETRAARCEHRMFKCFRDRNL